MKILIWHGESKSLFYVLDEKANDIEVIKTFHDLIEAENFIKEFNNASNE